MTAPTGFRRTVATTTIAAVVIVIIAVAVDMAEAAATFVVAYVTIVSIALGTLALALIAQLTTATWFNAFRARAELVIACLPALALVGMLLLVTLPLLYPWVGRDTPIHAYLNAPFFIIRYFIYWATWIGIGERFLRAPRSSAQLAAGGLVALSLTMTLASFDWMMSLTPDWQSTIYGVYWFAGGVLGALALLAVLTPSGGTRRTDDPGTENVHSLGKLMLTFVLFWLYIGFSQYIVIWSANIPREVTWYVSRTQGGWGLVAGVLLLGNFVFPFLLLILEPVMRARTALTAIGSVLLALRYLDMLWVIMPGLQPMRLWSVVVSAAMVTLFAVGGRALIFSRRITARAQSLRAGSRPELAA
jgi:hypothetical protein